MIAYVSGTLKRIEEDAVLIDVGGIGFRVFAPVREDLMQIGIDSPLTLYTYMSVREDAMLLYGFLTQDELALFKMLIGVKGVGPKFAMGILHALSAEDIYLAIARGDYQTLKKAPGVGQKTAQQIILDLKGKISLPEAETAAEVSQAASGTAEGPQGTAAEVIAALKALGYSTGEANDALKRVRNREALAQAGDVEELLSQCLMQLAIL